MRNANALRPALAALFALIFLLVGVISLPGVGEVLAQEPTPRPLYALPDARSNAAFTSSSIALDELNGLLATVNMLSDSVAIVAPIAGELRAEITVGDDPRTVTFTPDGLRVLTANRGDGTLSIVDLQAGAVDGTVNLGGVWPYGVVSANNSTAYVSLQGSGEVVVVDLTARTVTQRISTPPFPTGLALWGDFLYVSHLWSGDVSLIYLPQNKVVSTISTGGDTGMSPSLMVDVTRGEAYLPQTRAYASNTSPTYDTLVFPVVNVVQLSGLGLQRGQRITPDTADRPVNMPFAVEIDPFRRWLYVANAGSNDVSVIEIDSGLALGNIPVGSNPRGLVLNRDNSRLYVHNALDGTVAIIDTGTRNILDAIPINTALSIPVDVLIGAELFHSAADPRLSTDRWISCANCHFDGMSDGRVWQDMLGEPRNTPLLYDLVNTPPYTWTGGWDELADSEIKLRVLQAGLGLVEDELVQPPLGDPHAGLSLDLDTLVFYLETLNGPTSPFPADTPQVERGREVFEEQSCGACHALPLGTNLEAVDVGTGGTFDVPTVRWLWASAPYYHDGSAETLYDVFAMPGAHQLTMSVSPSDIDALVAYLLTLSDE